MATVVDRRSETTPRKDWRNLPVSIYFSQRYGPQKSDKLMKSARAVRSLQGAESI
jgi:hypothetical protein